MKNRNTNCENEKQRQNKSNPLAMTYIIEDQMIVNISVVNYSYYQFWAHL